MALLHSQNEKLLKRYIYIYSAVNVLYLACTIFCRNDFLNKLAWIIISVFLNVTTGIFMHLCMAFSDVLELAEPAFCQKR